MFSYVRGFFNDQNLCWLRSTIYSNNPGSIKKAPGKAAPETAKSRHAVAHTMACSASAQQVAQHIIATSWYTGTAAAAAAATAAVVPICCSAAPCLRSRAPHLVSGAHVYATRAVLPSVCLLLRPPAPAEQQVAVAPCCRCRRPGRRANLALRSPCVELTRQTCGFFASP